MNGNHLSLVKISLPAKIKDEDFESFMKQDVFPTINLGPTRTVQIVGGELLKELESERDYIWTVWWHGPTDQFGRRIDDVLEKLKSRGIHTSIRMYRYVSSVSDDN